MCWVHRPSTLLTISLLNLLRRTILLILENKPHGFLSNKDWSVIIWNNPIFVSTLVKIRNPECTTLHQVSHVYNFHFRFSAVLLLFHLATCSMKCIKLICFFVYFFFLLFHWAVARVKVIDKLNSDYNGLHGNC